MVLFPLIVLSPLVLFSFMVLSPFIVLSPFVVLFSLYSVVSLHRNRYRALTRCRCNKHTGHKRLEPSRLLLPPFLYSRATKAPEQRIVLFLIYFSNIYTYVVNSLTALQIYAIATVQR